MDQRISHFLVPGSDPSQTQRLKAGVSKELLRILTPGKELSARVVDAFSNDRYLLAVRGHGIVAESPRPLMRDSIVTILAQGGGKTGQPLSLQIAQPTPGDGLATSSEAGRRASLGLPDTTAGRVVLQAFEQAGAPLTQPARLTSAHAAVRDLPPADAARVAAAHAALARAGLPPTPALLQLAQRHLSGHLPQPLPTTPAGFVPPPPSTAPTNNPLPQTAGQLPPTTTTAPPTPAPAPGTGAGPAAPPPASTGSVAPPPAPAAVNLPGSALPAPAALAPLLAQAGSSDPTTFLLAFALSGLRGGASSILSGTAAVGTAATSGSAEQNALPGASAASAHPPASSPPVTTSSATGPSHQQTAEADLARMWSGVLAESMARGGDAADAASRMAREVLADATLPPQQLRDYSHVLPLALPPSADGKPVPARIAIAHRRTASGEEATFLRVDLELDRLGPLSLRISQSGHHLALTMHADSSADPALQAQVEPLSDALDELGFQASIRVRAFDEESLDG